MKQFEICCIAGEEPLNIQIYGPLDQNAISPLTAEFTLPASDGATSQILGIQEGETVHIY